VTTLTLIDLFEQMAEAGASDLHLCAGSPPVLRIRGELERLEIEPFTAEEMRDLVYRVTTLDQQKELEIERELDFSYALGNKWRFRLNAFFDRDSVACAVRLVPAAIPTLEDIRMPEIVRELAFRPRGLVLVTGPTGSGKSTTLAAMVDAINEERACHIVTVEDPIEFIHHDSRALVSQREIGPDAPSFSRALKAALRQDPDVILIGEIRDEDTALTALRAAETGHLVFATLHTSGAADTIARLMELFAGRGSGLGRQMLASSLIGVISQRLIRGTDGKRRVNCEVMVNTARMRECLTDGGDSSELLQIIAEGDYYGMQTFDQSLLDLVARGEVMAAEATAMAINAHNFRLELTQLDGSTDGSTDVLHTGLRPKA
jgi:twitching motility protein PilT